METDFIVLALILLIQIHVQTQYELVHIYTYFVINWFQVVQINNWSCITFPPANPDVNGDVDVTKTMPTQ